MSKITLNSVADLTQSSTAQTTINTNSSTVQTAFDNTLSRDGTSPNQMGAALDMNSNPIVNLPAPASAASPLRLQDLASFIGGGLNIGAIPPAPTPSTLGGVFSASAIANDFVTNIDSTGTQHLAQPSFTNISGTASTAQLPTATNSTLGIAQADGANIIATAGVLSPSAGFLSSVQGNFEFYNDGTTNGMVLGPYNGNNVVMWNSTTSTWVNFILPTAVAITNATNNGSGLIRITHAATTRPFITGQYVNINSVGGVPSANTAAPNSGPFMITVINSTQFDLVGSTFAGAYTSGGNILFGVSGNVGNITINGVSNQAVSPGNTYLVGITFLDAAATVAQLVLTTSLAFVHDPIMGFNVLPTVTNVPLVGMITYDSILGIQGNGSSELLISWYSRNMFGAQQTYVGNTGGVTGSFVNIPPSSTALKWVNWSDLSPDIYGIFSVSSSGAATVQVKMAVTGPTNFTSIQGLTFTGASTQQIFVPMPVEDQSAGTYTLAVSVQTSAGTATLGAAFNSVVRVYTNF